MRLGNGTVTQCRALPQGIKVHRQQQRDKHAILFRSDFGKSWRPGHNAPPGFLQMGIYALTNENPAVKPGGVRYRLLYINEGWRVLLSL